MFEDEQGVVHGEVMEYPSGELESRLQVFDRLEGYRRDDPGESLYLRVSKTVFLDNSNEAGVQAWTYVFPCERLRETEDTAIKIVGGDWLEYLRPTDECS
jgi:gamma-glutamylcyclotransferase (GGCT)/AIG2-like uncharacterized protein YtfP